MSANQKFLILGACQYEKPTWEAKLTDKPGILEFVPYTALTDKHNVYNSEQLDVTYDSKNYELLLAYRNMSGSNLIIQTAGQYLQSPSFDLPGGPYGKGEIGTWCNVLALQSGTYVSVKYELVNYYGTRLLYRGANKAFVWGSVNTVDHPHSYSGPRRLVHATENAKFVYSVSAAFSYKADDKYYVRFNIDTLAMSYFEKITDESSQSRLWSRFELGKGVSQDEASKRALQDTSTPHVIALYNEQDDTHWLYYFHLGWKENCIRYGRIKTREDGSLIGGPPLSPEHEVEWDVAAFLSFWPEHIHVSVFAKRVWIFTSGGHSMSCEIPPNAVLPADASGWVKNPTVLTTPRPGYRAWFYGIPVPSDFI
ncbi:hypothetical protein QBC44DRAFT_358162 [Cladorrhinum sp. PSN332]|nr:hypothetical protein QBC44DRAFT_358162 [Cladorrhinum sp. PSN332]